MEVCKRLLVNDDYQDRLTLVKALLPRSRLNKKCIENETKVSNSPIPMIIILLPIRPRAPPDHPILPLPLRKPNLQIRSGAEHPARTRHHNRFDPLVDIEQGEDLLDLFHHDVCKSIVLGGAVESYEDDASGGGGGGGDVGEFDVAEGEGGVGGGEGEGSWWGRHCFCLLRWVLRGFVSYYILRGLPFLDERVGTF